MAKPKKIAVVDIEKCIFCNVCANKCRFDALETFPGEWNLVAEKCIGCGLCSRVCVAEAITMVPLEAQA